jgi:lysosomal acid lipase/cholesteryl ester hydrolase
MDSADSWLINTKNQSLAYVLFDAGYDVWIGNSRANRYSKNNIYYSDTQAAYWSWDWDTMAQVRATLSPS